jgi:hypothetical protein
LRRSRRKEARTGPCSGTQPLASQEYDVPEKPEPPTTTDAGIPAASNEHSLTAGPNAEPIPIVDPSDRAESEAA